jgi:hypothetical protein
MVQKRQEQGVISKKYDRADILLAMTALVFFPVVFPQITRLIYGDSPQHGAFQKKWKAFMKQISSAIS